MVQNICSLPWQVSVERLSPADEVLILGCDGLWDVLSAEDAWNAAQRKGRRRDGTWDFMAGACALTTLALERGSRDNVSVVLIGLRGQHSKVGGMYDTS